MFGGRKSRGYSEPEILGNGDWPRLPETRTTPADMRGQPPRDLRGDGRPLRHGLPPHVATGPMPPPIPQQHPAAGGIDPDTLRRAAERELTDKINAFRSAVADALYEYSNDYRILCNLAHADLKSCGELMSELRERLKDDLHYRVLAKLDEAHALVKRGRDVTEV